MFELPRSKVTAIVSKMISHEELAAALDQVSGAIIFRKGVDLSRLQTLALALSDKASGTHRVQREDARAEDTRHGECL